MHAYLGLLLAAASTLVHQASAVPVIHSRTASLYTPVHPGGVEDLVITAENTLNATNPTPITNSMNDDLHTKAARANAQLPISLVNNIGGTMNAYITALDQSGRVVFVTKSGQFYYPPCDSSYTTPVETAADVAIPMDTAKGSTTQVTLPDYVHSARIWFAEGTLHFYMVWNAKDGVPGQVQPSFTNPMDPSAGVNWGFVEFTNDGGGVYANLSFVDFVGLSIGMSLTASGSTRVVRGLPASAVASTCSALQAQQANDSQPWGSLCQSGSSGPLRAIAPIHYMDLHSGAFVNFWSGYIDQVWSHYTNNVLTVDTQGLGEVACQVSGDSMTCNGDNRSYAKPGAYDIFGCNTGPFAINKDSDNDVHKKIVPRLCAAFNRGTYLINGGNVQPGPGASTYYKNAPANWYSSIIHQNEVDGRGYAFSYDDVNPTTGVDQSGTLADGNPQLLTVAVGGM